MKPEEKPDANVQVNLLEVQQDDIISEDISIFGGSGPDAMTAQSVEFRMAGDLDSALQTVHLANARYKGDPELYVELGATATHRMSLDATLAPDQKREIIAQVITHYLDALQWDPAYANAHLGLIETYCMIGDYDDAISVYGSSSPYMSAGADKVIRASLGCIALVLSGETLDEDDTCYLDDLDIRVSRARWCTAEIDRLLLDLKQSGENCENVDKAIAIHQKFLQHFDEEPLRIPDHL